MACPEYLNDRIPSDLPIKRKSIADVMFPGQCRVHVYFNTFVKVRQAAAADPI
jgi:hypothetical protein